MNVLECLRPVFEQNTKINGLIFAVTAVPTVGENGKEGIGGIGETWFADNLGEVSRQPTLGFGKAMRALAERQQSKLLSDPEFEAWRKELANTGTVQFEFEVDRTLWEMAQDSAHKIGVAVIAGKAVSLLKETMLKEKEKPTVVAIGVSIEDSVATLRNWKREHQNSDVKPSKQELNQVAQRRYQRLQDERQTFARAYPKEIPHYSNASVLKSVNYVLDNTPNRTEKEMQTVSINFLQRKLSYIFCNQKRLFFFLLV